MNQSINDKAVYRTAPATPGLLKIIHNVKKQTQKERRKKSLQNNKRKNIFNIHIQTMDKTKYIMV